MAAFEIINAPTVIPVSTHSHPKVAAFFIIFSFFCLCRFNTQPPEGGCSRSALSALSNSVVSTHSHPKVAAAIKEGFMNTLAVSTHSHPKVAASGVDANAMDYLFQHTATRRWLQSRVLSTNITDFVSTHSHPKVAATSLSLFNQVHAFQHTATRRWLHF